MTELEIHIRSWPPLTNFTTETLSEKNGLVIRLCPKNPLSSASRMQQLNIRNMDPASDIEPTCESCIDEIEEEELEESYDNEVFTSESMPSPLQSSHIPITSCASSTPIAIPSPSHPTNHRRLSGSGMTPPHHNSYLYRVSPWAPVDSPTSLSSGYGSSPRLLTASTQTPPSLFTFDIRLRFSPAHSPVHRSPSADLRRERIRRQILQSSGSERRLRYHSEGSGTDAVQAVEPEDPSNPSQPLPDLVNTAFRPRANTEPSRPRAEIQVGEQLRRISDEFHLSYEEVRNLRRRRENQGWLSRVIEHFRGGPRHEAVAEERPQGAEVKHANNVQQNQ